MRASDVKEGE